MLLAVFSIAENRSSKDASGNWEKKTLWHEIVVWGDFAQRVGEKLETGAMVYVEGKLTTREWTDRDNNPRTSTEVVASEVHFVDVADKRNNKNARRA